MKRIVWHIGLFVAVWAFVSALYAPVYGSYFLSDDFPLIAAVRGSTQPWYTYPLTNMVGTHEGGIYRPLVRATLALNEYIGRGSPIGYFALNIFIHALVAYMVGAIAYEIVHTRKRLAAALAALTFAALGNHAEAVNWISSRGDTLAALWMLGALWCWIRFRARGAYGYLAGVAGCALAALWSKEMALTLPLLFVVVDVWLAPRARRSARALLLPYALLGALVAAYLGARAYTTHIVWGYYNQPVLRANMEKIVSTPLGITVSNVLSGFPRTYVIVRALKYAWLSYAALFAALAALWRMMRSERFACALGCAFLYLGALPVMNLGMMMITDENERFAYVPSIGWALFAALAACYAVEYVRARTAARRAWGVVLLISIGVFVCAQGYITYQKSVLWRVAGNDARSLLADMRPFVTNPHSGAGGIVILGVPDNISGAYVFRNGFFDALKMRYPAYVPDVLPAKVNLRARMGFAQADSNLVWSASPDGKGFTAHAQSGARSLYGEPRGASPDYAITLEHFDPATRSADGIAIAFTDIFLAHMKTQPITFLAFDKGHLTQVFLTKSSQ